MSSNENTKLILGLKIKQLRVEKKISAAELAQKSGLSISYLNEIEKGKKYPKSDKITAIAQSLGTEYESLISLQLNKKLAPIAHLFDSSILTDLPLEMFGLEAGDFLNLLSEVPDKLSAFINTIIHIGRRYDITIEEFYFLVLRSYQEINDNYFPHLEEKAVQFWNEVGQKHGLISQIKYDWKVWATLLEKEYQYDIQEFTKETHPKILSLRSILVKKDRKKPLLLLNSTLNPEQRAFIIAREIGYNFMKIKNRPLPSSVFQVENFEQIFNNFQASYFAGALLINKNLLIKNIHNFFHLDQWKPDALMDIVNQFMTTPEVFFHRLSSILTSHFGINQLFFLRFNKTSDQRFVLSKEFHLSKLHIPHANLLKEHYCGRWVSLNILKELEKSASQLLCKAQISHYPEDKYLVLSIARKTSFSNTTSSVSLGLAIDSTTLQMIRFIQDPDLPRKKVGETCERCAIENCFERSSPPVILEKKIGIQSLKKAIRELG